MAANCFEVVEHGSGPGPETMTILDGWERILKSLETDGGRLVVLLAMLFTLLGMVLWMLSSGHTPAETGRALIASTISALFGILLGYLQKKTS